MTCNKAAEGLQLAFSASCLEDSFAVQMSSKIWEYIDHCLIDVVDIPKTLEVHVRLSQKLT